MIIEYARYMNGSHQVSELMRMKKRDFMFWYEAHSRRIIEDKIISDDIEKKKNPPFGIALKNRVDNYIKKRREELNR